MVIEYKIRFEEGGVAITQRMSSEKANQPPNASQSLITGTRDSVILGDSFIQRPAENPKKSDAQSSSKAGKDAKGGSESIPSDTGSGGSLGGLTLVFGNLVMGSTIVLGSEKPDRKPVEEPDHTPMTELVLAPPVPVTR